MARLGEICTIYSGTGFPVQYQGLAEGQYPFYKVGDIAKNVIIGNKYLNFCENYVEADVVKKIKGTVLPSRTVVFAKIGEAVKLNRRAITSCACLIDNNAMGIAPNESVLILDYFFHYMCSLRLETLAEATTVPSVKKSLIEKLDVPLPSISEQRRIAECLNKVSELIALRKEQLAKLDQLVKSRFIELFGGISDSKKYPYKAVKELTDVISGGTPSREVHEYWEGGTIPWVKTTELQNNIITEIDEHITEAGLDNSSAKLVPMGTVLIAMYGQGKTRGMTGYLGVEACTNQACACILPSDSINQKFLWQFFVLSYDNLREMAKGGNQPNLNGNIIKNYPVLYPPMELQEQFATFVEQTDKSKLAIQQSLDKLELLKKSLMQEYFG